MAMNRQGLRKGAFWMDAAECMVGVAAVLLMAVGCSRPTPVEEPFYNEAFDNMEYAIWAGGSCGKSVRSLGERIAALPDVDERRRCIDRFKGVFLAPETNRIDHHLVDCHLMKGRSDARNDLADLCVNAAKRCGLSFSEILEIRIAFVEWLRAERKRIADSENSSNDDGSPARFMTAKDYLDSLAEKLFHNTWRLELQFDEDAERECRPDELERLRARLETFLGRPIRTKEEIQYDRRKFEQRNMKHLEKWLPEPSGWDE